MLLCTTQYTGLIFHIKFNSLDTFAAFKIGK